jgi:hypothetical protein
MRLCIRLLPNPLPFCAMSYSWLLSPTPFFSSNPLRLYSHPCSPLSCKTLAFFLFLLSFLPCHIPIFLYVSFLYFVLSACICRQTRTSTALKKKSAYIWWDRGAIYVCDTPTPHSLFTSPSGFTCFLCL